ncbi:MAG TPA: DUF3025 domain-containing protein [Burkholderiaceae bacterium]|nr:DUF3025 domain-containing protein [Burkholderiaceae bacterium]
MNAAAIDPAVPWFAPYRTDGAALCTAIAGGVSAAAALDARAVARLAPIRLDAGPLRFVEAAAQPRGEAYESFIARTAAVPTRDNRHDLLNGLVWLCFPELKRRMNELQAAAIAAQGIGPARGPLRDALTVFDENGALLRAPAVLAEALRRRDWHTLFIAQREAWREAELALIGHALLDKLTAPRKPIVAHVLIVEPGEDPVSRLSAAHLAGKPFWPLPVLGVPGWWPANDDPRFYDDPAVFRRG